MIPFFLFLFSLVFLIGRFNTFADPILRNLLTPIAGICFLLFSGFPLSYDYFTILFLLASLILLSLFFSTPTFCPAKVIFTSRFVRFFQILSVFAFVFCFLDSLFNTDFTKSVFLTGNFDLRVDLSYPILRFFKNGFFYILIPLLLFSRFYSTRFFYRLNLLSTILYWVPYVCVPGKGLILSATVFTLNYVFWRSILFNDFHVIPTLSFRRFALSKASLRNIFYLLFLAFSVIAITLYFLSRTTGISLASSLQLLEFRIFPVSYELAFSILRSPNFHLDLNIPPPEFSNILHLWLKPYFKFLGSDFVFDTIPKYIQYSLNGFVTYGIGSPNSTLFVEATLIHGRILGTIVTLFFMLIGCIVRRKILSSSSLNLATFAMSPLLTYGPSFCFQDAQSFFTAFIPFLFLNFLAYFLSFI